MTSSETSADHIEEIVKPSSEGSEPRTHRFTPDQIAKLPQVHRGLEDVLVDFRHRIERAHVLQNRWLLWLVVANAGALTALSSKQLDALSKSGSDEAYAAFALVQPSMWFFFFGLMFAAVAGLQELLANMQVAKSLHNSLRALQSYPEAKSYQPMEFPTLKDWAAEIVSAACFLGGLAYPLIVLALRYLTHGHFSW